MTEPMPAAPSRRAEEVLGAILCALILLLFVSFALEANWDARHGRAVLHMDERITFDGVRAILNATDANSFAWAVLDGGDHRYGRILFNLSALASWRPHTHVGAPEQIRSTRMLQASLLFAAYLLLLLTFLTGWGPRALGMLALCALPSTAYYATMPKPEPLQLFLIALFLARAHRVGWAPGSHWFFLGLAFGTKISVLPLAAALAVVAFFSAPRDWRLPVAGAGFIVGWVVAVPVVVLGGLGTWFRMTFQNTSHGADDASVTLLTWLHHLLTAWTPLPPVAKLLLAGAFVWLTVQSCRKALAAGLQPREPYFTGVLLVLAGLAMGVPILLKVKRVWDMYLHVAAVLSVTGGLRLLEARFNEEAWAGSSSARRLSMLGLGVAALVCAAGGIREFQVLSERSRQPDFKANLARHDRLEALLERLARVTGRRLLLLLDPYLFPPDPGPGWEVRHFWGPLLDWPGADVTVMLPDHAPSAPLPAPTHVEYQAALKARELYARHVVVPGAPAVREEPLYEEVTLEGSGLLVLLRQDLKPQWDALGLGRLEPRP